MLIKGGALFEAQLSEKSGRQPDSTTSERTQQLFAEMLAKDLLRLRFLKTQQACWESERESSVEDLSYWNAKRASREQFISLLFLPIVVPTPKSITTSFSKKACWSKQKNKIKSSVLVWCLGMKKKKMLNFWSLFAFHTHDQAFRAPFATLTFERCLKYNNSHPHSGLNIQAACLQLLLGKRAPFTHR